MSKMNSIDRAYRNEKDILELLEIADKATRSYLAIADWLDGSYVEASALRISYDALIARRAAEDEGRATV